LRGASAKASDIETATTSEVAVVREAPEAEAAWERAWRAANESLGSHPLFRRLRGAGSSLASSRVARAGRDVAEGLRERWDTSDSPLVHRIQDATDSFFAEGEQALALRKVMARDPGFDTARFLGQVKADVPEIIVAYLQGQEDVIRQHCTPEMTERLTGIMAATRAAGQIPDPTLLDTSDVELVDLKLLDDQPIVVVQFTCQQINCARDAHGNVVDGAPDDVHRVYYYWALQQEEQGYRGADGRVHPPRWQLREMLIRGMHHLL
ncbi:Tim44-like domain-containing protein, partial [Helicosporidium sp. ATCC 50920]